LKNASPWIFRMNRSCISQKQLHLALRGPIPSPWISRAIRGHVWNPHLPSKLQHEAVHCYSISLKIWQHWRLKQLHRAMQDQLTSEHQREIYCIDFAMQDQTHSSLWTSLIVRVIRSCTSQKQLHVVMQDLKNVSAKSSCMGSKIFTMDLESNLWSCLESSFPKQASTRDRPLLQQLLEDLTALKPETVAYGNAGPAP